MLYQPVFTAFFDQVKSSINQATFAKLTLAKTIGDTELKNIYARLHITEDKEYKFELTLRYKTEEVTSIHTVDETFSLLSSYIKNPFTTALLFTTESDITFKVNKKNAGSLIEQPPTFKHASPIIQEMLDLGIISL